MSQAGDQNLIPFSTFCRIQTTGHTSQFCCRTSASVSVTFLCCLWGLRQSAEAYCKLSIHFEGQQTNILVYHSKYTLPTHLWKHHSWLSCDYCAPETSFPINRTTLLVWKINPVYSCCPNSWAAPEQRPWFVRVSVLQILSPASGLAAQPVSPDPAVMYSQRKLLI